MAQTKLRLEFEESAPRVSWVGETPTPPPSATSNEGKTADVTADATQGSSTVWIWNRATGNMATRPVKSIQGMWPVKLADFTLVGKVTVRVESHGQPVASAEVALKDSKADHSALLTPGDKGELSFYGLAPGNLALTVRYKVAGKEAEPVKQSFDVSIKRDKPDPQLIVSIPDAVDVVATPTPSPSGSALPLPGASGAPGGAAASTPTPAQSIDSPSIIGRIITLLLVLALIGGGGYYLLLQMRKNSDLVQDKLRQLGVDVPKGMPATPVDAVVPAPLAPQPPQKIVLSDATPDPVVAAAPISLSAPTGVPRLVLSNGDAFDLPEGETVIGRELGLGLSLTTETTLSRRHASIIKSGSIVQVTDLGSSNGTYVNGAKISIQTPLRPGDSVQFGSVQARFEG